MTNPVAITSMESPIGELWLAATTKGLCALSFGGTRAELLNELGTPEELPEGKAPALKAARAWLLAYFARATPKPLPPFDLAGTPFQLRVWEELGRVPLGELLTYGDLAARTDCKSARAIGGAVGRNPVPILIPCHRVVAAGGGLGGFSGGLDIKRRLLLHEGFRVEARSERLIRIHADKTGASS